MNANRYESETEKQVIEVKVLLSLISYHIDVNKCKHLSGVISKCVTTSSTVYYDIDVKMTKSDALVIAFKLPHIQRSYKS
jgi:hypothetical protein